MEVLDMSKLESGEVTLEESPFDLHNISKEVQQCELVGRGEILSWIRKKQEITH